MQVSVTSVVELEGAELIEFDVVNYLNYCIEKNNNVRTVQSESSTFASLLLDQGFPKIARLQLHLANWNAI